VHKAILGIPSETVTTDIANLKIGEKRRARNPDEQEARLIYMEIG
jgi:hypothetical protein